MITRQKIYLLVGLGTIAFQAQAAIVVYTDSQHPPLLTSDSQVVYLDAPETVQQQAFGELPIDPQQAERVALAAIHSSDWKRREQKIIQAYQGVLQAYSLKLGKYPAVVFDDRYVVYGTADVVLAESKLAEHKGRQ
ncbi:integrating conjugative element protein%2C PFL_4709 family [Yersinia enterocolitica]|nr:integrating conjugative element protein%2C PFL_4709 family [Yersinia enterocolitica]